MYYVYLLQDEESKLYIGYSSDLRRRLGEHQAGRNVTTSKMKNIRLIYYESYSEENLARQRELKLKAFGSAYTALLKRLGIK